ncbi:MAG TPA: energy transducer TonB [Candidatus Acidoferrum sp.]|nr:energy transducer TonB [Candidatus Acidoferrum sp.]
MSAIAADRSTPSLKGFLYLSMAMHGGLIALMIFSGFLSNHGQGWGGPGGAVTVGLVGNVPGIPLPRPEVVTPNRVVDESKGLYKTQPPEIKAPPPPDAVPIPKFKLKPPPHYVSRPSKVLENPTPPPPNAVPYGGGGTPTVPYTSFAMGSGTATQGGLGFNGAGGGDFGSRFPWYVQAVQRRVSGSWLQSTIDPSISVAPRVVATFDVLRDGTITNIQITRSSGNYSVDSSAVRAIRDSSPLNPLPGEYSGSRVSVEFWFDFHR